MVRFTKALDDSLFHPYPLLGLALFALLLLVGAAPMFCADGRVGSVEARLLEGLETDGDGYRILVKGTERRLILLQKDSLVYDFRAAFGRRGLGKEREGDCKTPLGDYRIKWMVSRSGPLKKNPGGLSSRVVDGMTYSVLDTELYFGRLSAIRVKTNPDGTRSVSKDPRDRPISAREIQIAQDEKLWTDSYGGKNVYIMAIDYPNESDRRAGRTGSSIEIHASAHLRRRGFEKYSGTHGCIAMMPDDAARIYAPVVVGTPVRIIK
jgi:L,D-peptidoglycan transpeptidase YkuD (ErfK/YbiS/YcfS/YnhG family)